LAIWGIMLGMTALALFAGQRLTFTYRHARQPG
jgi:hypothetical protein